MRIIAIANLKGGVGKTTVCHNLAGALAERGARVLLLDMDHQGNLTSIYLDDNNVLEKNGGIARALFDAVPLRGAIVPTGVSGISIVPANDDLALLDVRYATDLNAHFQLAELLEAERPDFDYVLIDSPPSLGFGTRMALVAAHAYVVPLDPHRFSYKGSQRLQDVVRDIRRRANPDLQFLGYVVNRVQSRRSLTDANIALFKELFKNDLRQTMIRESIKYQEATSEGLPITAYLPASEYADSFRSLIKELQL